MNDLRNEIDTLFALYVKHTEKGLPTKDYPNLWKILKNISDPNEIFIADFMPNEYVETWVINCKEKEHSQQVAYSVHHEVLTQVCFNCKKVRVTAKMKVKD